LGCFPASDGKIYPGDLDNVLNVVDGRKARHAGNWVMEQLGEINPMKVIKDTLPNAATQKRIKEAKLTIKTNSYVQWKPESIHQLSKYIADEIEAAGNIQFSFDNEVHKIIKKKGYFQITTASGDFVCKNIILAVGRSGWRWATNLYKELGITVSDDIARYGVRAEISAQHMKEFNKSHCSLMRDDLEIGPFSWNGTVIPEDHADLVISAFRSNEERWKSDKVSFSILSPKFFQDNGSYQADRLGKLAFLLFNDRVSRERVRTLIKDGSQLNLLPEYAWLKDTLTELDVVIPNLLNRGYFHVPDILPMASQISLGTNLESEVDGMFVAGESAGIKGILAAAVTGTICSDSICR
ncbi:MAG TPA: hypothetical protein VM577_08595, partial [Anaerovoracaceae bacterium]|nr:hypothetical protein [Anaerovoracaceae bacterium]